MTAPLLAYHAGRKVGDVVTVKLETLYETRLLIQGSSGAGKTQACFHLLEETHGHVQQIVVDKEGEFGKLAEKFDYLVIGGDGPQRIPLRKGALELQLTRVLELEISAIYDLSDLVPDQQRHVVARLARAMAHVPQRSGLWDRMRLALFDEMQWFAPQNGKAESLEPLIELASTGRKRGFCFIAAGTRVSMMAKSVTELLENKLIGRSGMNDAERAAKELEFDKHGRKELRSLPIGHFYAYGPAIAIDPVLVRTPAELPVVPRRRGEHRPPAPAPSAKVKLVLEKFAGLEEEAEKKERTEEELRTELAAANRRIQQLQKGAPVVDRVVEKVVVDDRAIARAVAAERQRHQGALRILTSGVKQALHQVRRTRTESEPTEALLAGVLDQITNAGTHTEDSRAAVQVGNQEQGTGANHPSVSAVGRSSRAPARPIATPPTPDGNVAPGEQKLLDAAARLRAVNVDTPFRSQLAVLAGVSTTSSTTDHRFAALLRNGLLVAADAGRVRLTDAGIAAAAPVETPPTLREYHEEWRRMLDGSALKLFDTLRRRGKGDVQRSDLASDAGVSTTSSTTDGAFAQLLALGLITVAGKGQVKPGPTMYPEGL